VARGERFVEAFGGAAGRSLDGFAPAHLVFITVGRDFEAARAAWVSRLSQRYNQDFGPLADKYGFIGTPAMCIEQVERFAEAGCPYFLLNAAPEIRDEAEQLAPMASEILPSFRKNPLTPPSPPGEGGSR
jgi:alkanesulfonate monooxygenase SsuD/methylene tetrahydromethanopterin reductase-like flavin-dependent oxidoreductase (luciferase family)